MAPELKTLIPKVECSRQPSSIQVEQPGPSLPLNLAELQQVAVVFALIMIAVWTPQGRDQYCRESHGGVLHSVVHGTQSLFSS